MKTYTINQLRWLHRWESIKEFFGFRSKVGYTDIIKKHFK